MSPEGIGGFFPDARRMEVWSVEEKRKIGELPLVVRTESFDGTEIILHCADGTKTPMRNGGGRVYTRTESFTHTPTQLDFLEMLK